MNMERIIRVNDNCVVGASGEVSDFQYLQRLLRELAVEDYCADDGLTLTPEKVYAYLTRVVYNRRNKMDPLWNTVIVAGRSRVFSSGASVSPNVDGSSGSSSTSTDLPATYVPFLGCVMMNGTHYTDIHMATGFGNHLARPLFRESHRPDMSKAEAEALLTSALKVCFYRDKQSINKFQIAVVTEQGAEISAPFALDVKWDFKHYKDPTRLAPGAW